MYIFDHYALLYMIEEFPRIIAQNHWKSFECFCLDGTIISQKEAQKSMDNTAKEPASLDWSKNHAALFLQINGEEAQVLGEMMKKKEFDFFDKPQLVIRRTPEAIPFILCMAKVQKRIYVYRKSTNLEFLPRIMKICNQYGIAIMETQEWLTKINT